MTASSGANKFRPKKKGRKWEGLEFSKKGYLSE